MKRKVDIDAFVISKRREVYDLTKIGEITMLDEVGMWSKRVLLKMEVIKIESDGETTEESLDNSDDEITKLPRCYGLRQNPYGLKSPSFYNFISENDIITAPFGHNSHLTDKILNKEYSLEARNQDRRFVEELKEGDHIFTPIEGTRRVLHKVLLSDTVEVRTFLNVYDVYNVITKKVVAVQSAHNLDANDLSNPELNFEPKKMVYRKCRNLPEIIIDHDVDLRNVFTQSIFQEVKHPELIKHL